MQDYDTQCPAGVTQTLWTSRRALFGQSMGGEQVSISVLSKFVFWAGIYNLVLAAGMAVSTVTRALGINIADPVLGQMIAGFLLFTAVIQMFGSRDLETYGWTIFWEGILRWIAALLLVAHGFFGHLGGMAGVLGLGDFLIGLVFLFILPRVIRKSPAELLAGR